MIRVIEGDMLADFVDWLADHGYVIAKYNDERQLTPISEDDGERLAASYINPVRHP